MVFALGGSYIGARITLLLSERSIQILMLFILPVTALYVLRGRSLDAERVPYSLSLIHILKKSRKNGKILPEPTKTKGMRLDLTKQVHAFCFLKYVLLFSQRESRFQIQNPQGLRYSRPLCPLLCRIHSRNWGAIP